MEKTKDQIYHFIVAFVVTGLAFISVPSVAQQKIVKSGFGQATVDMLGISSGSDVATVSDRLKEHARGWPERPGQLIQSESTFGTGSLAQKYTYQITLGLTASDQEEMEKRGVNSEEIRVRFTAPPSGNGAYLFYRTLSGKEQSLEAFFTRMIEKYGIPSFVGNGLVFYIYKDGKLLSDGKSYTSMSAAAALARKTPGPPVDVATKTNLMDCGELGMSRDLSGISAARDHKRVGCDAVLYFRLLPFGDRFSVFTSGFLDILRTAEAGQIDAKALDEIKKQDLKSRPVAPPSKL